MVTKSSTVTMKKAAQVLGIHQETIRNWEKRGLIRLVRLPGSGYRRVPRAEIERLLSQMAAPSDPFWDGQTARAVARAQGVRPVQSIDDLWADFWPEDESVEEFRETIHAWRQRDLEMEREPSS
ncbi:MAG: MerR family DNA-binding transcriptional regulator [Anaerolineae bacterium]